MTACFVNSWTFDLFSLFISLLKLTISFNCSSFLFIISDNSLIFELCSFINCSLSFIKFIQLSLLSFKSFIINSLSLISCSFFVDILLLDIIFDFINALSFFNLFASSVNSSFFSFNLFTKSLDFLAASTAFLLISFSLFNSLFKRSKFWYSLIIFEYSSFNFVIILWLSSMELSFSFKSSCNSVKATFN